MELSFSLRLPQEAASVPVVRHVCKDALTHLGVRDDCVHDICVAVTEACSNVLRHSEAAPSDYQVKVNIDGDSCRIEVTDTGKGFDPADAGSTSSPVTAQGGRGIFLMRELVDEVVYSEEAREGTSVILVKGLALTENSMLARLVG